jgi:hypothetical protein
MVVDKDKLGYKESRCCHSHGDTEIAERCFDSFGYSRSLSRMACVYVSEAFTTPTVDIWYTDLYSRFQLLSLFRYNGQVILYFYQCP